MFLSGGLSARAYLRTVFLWMPSSRAVALRESPLSLACCTFSQRVLWRAVGILCCCALDLRGLKSRSTSAEADVGGYRGCKEERVTMPTEISTCPIWGDRYKAEGVYHPQDRMFEVRDSTRAFAGYKVSEVLLKSFINRLSNRQKAWLTTWIIDQWVIGNDEPRITFEVLSAIRRKGALPVYKRADRLLRWVTMATHTATVGVNLAIPQNDYGYQAWSESTEWSEVQYLLVAQLL